MELYAGQVCTQIRLDYTRLDYIRLDLIRLRAPQGAWIFLTTHFPFLIYLENVKSSYFLAALSSTKSTVVRLSVCLLVGRLALGVCEKVICTTAN